MNFTYDSYRCLLGLLRENGYEASSYYDWKYKPKCVIMRHDIDFDINKAIELATIEREMGVASTYFVLLTSDFYNVFSHNSSECLKDIVKLGHTVGLHFDEARYPECEDVDSIVALIKRECKLLGKAIDRDIDIVSMHRPSKKVLDADISIPGIINSYGGMFFNEFKYLSDSRRRWREPVEEVINSKQFNRLHILTHAFWYNDHEQTIGESLREFVNKANRDRYEQLLSNITDLYSIMDITDVR